MLDPEDLLEYPNMTRRERRATRKKSGNKQKQNRQTYNQQQPKEDRNPLALRTIFPKTANQSLTFDYFNQNKNLLLHGYAGCGKTFLACYLGIKEVLENNETFEKLIIVRSALATRDIGFLPGSKQDKEKAFEEPYYDIFSKLFGRPDAYDVLKRRGLVEFRSTTHIRGITLDNSIVIVDEFSNCSWIESSGMITRLGDNTRIIFCGDFRQSDHRFKDDKQGVVDFLDVIKDCPSFAHVEMGIDDIVRGKTVREFIIAAARKGLM